MAGGRPTKYCPEILEAAREYIANYQAHGDKIPSIAGLAVVLKVGRDTLHIWAKDEDKAEFSYILAELLATQEKLLVNNGLDGTFNAAITKLVLGKHGYSEKLEQGFDPEKPLKQSMTVEFVNGPDESSNTR